MMLMVFVFSTLLIATSVQLLAAPTVTQALGSFSHSNLSAQELALLGLSEMEADIATRLDGGGTIDTSYAYPLTEVKMPSNPSALNALDNTLGSYSGSITQARGDNYLVKVHSQVGMSSVELYKLLQVSKHQYDCSVVEDQILTGHIADVSDSDLIAYAQNDCMVKTASTTVTAPLAGSGSGACNGSYTGSGTVSLASVTCNVTVGGTYDTIQYRSPTSTSGGGRYLYSYPAAGFTGVRTVHIPGTVGAGDSFRAFNSGGTKSTYPHIFLFNTPGLTSSFATRGGDGDDIVSFTGTTTSDVYTNNGNNTVIINGMWGNASDYNTMYLGESGAGHTGSNTVYVDSLKGSAGASIYTYSSGSTSIYFNNLSGGSVGIYGGSANDIIGCGVSFTGGTGVCGSASAGAYTIEGKGGGDIISLDFLLPAATVRGNTGATEETGSIGNIIYTKGSASGSTISTNNKNSLVISAGNRAGAIAAQSGGNCVLLKKSGTTDSGTNSNFARTLTY